MRDASFTSVASPERDDSRDVCPQLFPASSCASDAIGRDNLDGTRNEPALSVTRTARFFPIDHFPDGRPREDA